MKRKFTGVWIILLLSVSAQAQTFEETLTYINEGFVDYARDHDLTSKERRKDGALVKSDRSLAEDIELRVHYERWAVNSTGKLTIDKLYDVWTIPAGTKYPNWLYDDPKKTKEGVTSRTTTVYLKQIDTTILHSHENSSFLGPISSLKLNCKSTSWCFYYSSVDEKGSDNTYYSYLSDYSGAKRVKKAIKHLCKLAENNDAFYSKDPFSE